MRMSAHFASRVPIRSACRISVAIGWSGCRQGKAAQFALVADTTVGISVPSADGRVQETRDRHRGYGRASGRASGTDHAMAGGFAISLVLRTCKRSKVFHPLTPCDQSKVS